MITLDLPQRHCDAVAIRPTQDRRRRLGGTGIDFVAARLTSTGAIDPPTRHGQRRHHFAADHANALALQPDGKAVFR